MKKLLTILLFVLLVATTVSAGSFYDDSLLGVSVPEPEFNFIGTSSTSVSSGLVTYIQVRVYDNVTKEPLGSGYPVEIYCLHNNQTNHINSGLTDAYGYVESVTSNIFPSSTCVYGDVAWVTVEYQNQVWTSEQFLISVNRFYYYAKIPAYVGVPEFSTATLALAVVFGALGLGVLRRK